MPLSTRPPPPPLYWLALCAVLAGALFPTVALDTPARAASYRVHRDYFGLHDGSLLAANRLRYGSMRIWDAGASWREVETSPGHYNWSRLDAIVSSARVHHVHPTLVMAMTPPFYNRGDPSKPPASLSHYRAYVHAVMTRYRRFGGQRAIWDYQVWNEGNVSDFWTGTPHQLAQLTRIAREVRNRVDPHARLLAPPFAVRLPSQRTWMARYERQRAGGRPVWRYYQAVALSLYPTARYGHRTGVPEDAIMLLGKVRQLLARACVPATTPIWTTEVNYGLRGGAMPGGAAVPISARRQVANVLRTYLLSAARGIRRVFWYRYDWGTIPGGGTYGNTILSDPADPSRVTQAGLALNTVERWMAGRLVPTAGHHEPCVANRLGTYTCVVRSAHSIRRIYWNPRRHATVHPRSGAASIQRGRGPVRQLPGEPPILRVDYLPVMVRWLRHGSARGEQVRRTRCPFGRIQRC